MLWRRGNSTGCAGRALEPEGRRPSVWGEAPAQRTTGYPRRRLSAMSHREIEHLRVLIANERRDRLALVAPIVAALGNEVIAREIEVRDVGAVTARERPDVALVGLGESSQHALELIEKIVQEAACPVIVLIQRPIPPLSRRRPNAHLRLHHRRRSQGLAELDRHRPAPLHGVPRRRGRVRATAPSPSVRRASS
jgi:hypothetical protein